MKNIKQAIVDKALKNHIFYLEGAWDNWIEYNAIFNNLNIFNIDFRKPYSLTKVEFNNCIIRNSNFSGVRGNIIFNNCIIENTDFSDSMIHFSVFKNCFIKDSDFSTASLIGCNFINTYLKDIICTPLTSFLEVNMYRVHI